MLLSAFTALLLAGGCSTVRVTSPARTATEMFLISQAAEGAVAQLTVTPLRDQKVYLDTSHFVGPDSEFVAAEVRSHLLRDGVRLFNASEQADVIVELRSGALSIDRYESLFGIPALLAPAGAGAAAGPAGAAAGESATLIVPELAILKTIKQYGFASVAIVAYRRDTGELVGASGPFIGRTYRKDWWFFGFGPRITGDIPPVEPQVDQ